MSSKYQEMNKLFFIIGASGAGKTTSVKALETRKLPQYKFLYFDSIGVPSFEEMQTKFGGPEEWQKIKTTEWVKKIKEEFLSHTHVVFDGQTRPSFIEEACVKNEIHFYEVILIDCSDEERKKRLIERGQIELADQNMMNWAQYLREESKQRNYRILDNTQLTPAETLRKLLELILL